jgi:hypothetical protein
MDRSRRRSTGCWSSGWRSNPLNVIVVALCAVSVSTAIFVIRDLDIPYGGLFGVPSDTMRHALADMMR